MKEKITQLRKILSDLNIKKDVRSSSRVVAKQVKTASELLEKIQKIVKINNNVESQATLVEAQRLFQEIKNLQKGRAELVSLKATVSAIVFANRIQKFAKMTTILEIVKTIPALLPQYSGEGEKLNCTIAALNACKVLISEANKEVAIQVILSRFDGKARSAVGDNPRTIEEIIEKLTNKCKSTIAPETIVAKLNATRQTGDLAKFTDQVENLTLQLERAYINEKVPDETATRLAVKAGIKALAIGVKNNETRLVLKAGQFTTLSAAVEKMSENESPTYGTTNILHYRTQNTRGNAYHGNRNNYRNRGNSNRNNNYGRNQPRTYSTFRGAHNNNGYQRQNNQNYNRYSQNRAPFTGSRVFVAQTGNQPNPQPGQVGGQRQYHGQTQINQQPQIQIPNQVIHQIRRT